MSQGLDLRWIGVWFGVLTFGWLITSGWMQASLIFATKQWAGGVEAGLGDIMGRGLRRVPSLIGTLLLVGLLILGAFLLCSIPALGVFLIASARGDLGALGEMPLVALFIGALLLGLLAAVVLIFLIGIRYAMAPVVSVLEERSPTDAMQRSKDLMKGRWFDFFLLMLMLMVVGTFIGFLITGPTFLIQTAPLQAPKGFENFPTLPRVSISFAGAVIVALSTYLAQIATSIISYGSYANFYLGLRGDEVMAESSAGTDLGPGSPAKDQPDPNQNEYRSGNGQGAGKLIE